MPGRDGADPATENELSETNRQGYTVEVQESDLRLTAELLARDIEGSTTGGKGRLAVRAA